MTKFNKLLCSECDAELSGGYKGSKDGDSASAQWLQAVAHALSCPTIRPQCPTSSAILKEMKSRV